MITMEKMEKKTQMLADMLDCPFEQIGSHSAQEIHSDGLSESSSL